MLSAPVDVAQKAGLLLGQGPEGRVSQQLAEADDRVERGPQFMRHVGEELGLHPQRLFQLHGPLPDPLFQFGGMLPDLRIESGILDGDGRLSGEGGEEGDLVVLVGPGGRGVEDEHPEEAVFELDRQPEVGDEAVRGGVLGVAQAGVSPAVGYGQGLPGGRHLSREALAQGDHDVPFRLQREPDPHAVAKHPGRLVQEKETHEGGARDAGRLADDGLQDLLQVQRRGHGLSRFHEGC